MHLTRMPSIVQNVIMMEQKQNVDKIRWKLQSPGVSDPFFHALEILNGSLHRFGRFKFGHTHKPAERVEKFRICKQSVTRFVVVFITENSDLSAKLEASLVARFRDDPRMLNWGMGGRKTIVTLASRHFLCTSPFRNACCARLRYIPWVRWCEK